jgi:hypothetical protein
MISRLTRRDFVRAGGLAGAVSLAGCGAGGDAGANETTDANGSAGDGPTPTAAAGEDAGSVAAGTDAATVGQVVAYPFLSLLVTAVSTPATVRRGTVDLEPGDGMAFYRVRYAFKNSGDAYLALGFDAFELDDGDERHDVTDLFSPERLADFGGLALAPGELQSATATFEVPVGTNAPVLRFTPSVRRLPGSFESLPEAAVDLVSVAGTPATLTQGFVNPLAVGESGSIGGVAATLTDRSVRDTIVGFDPVEGVEYAVVGLSVANDSALPITADVGGIGGMAVADGEGRSFGRRLEVEGEFEGRPVYDGERLEPGASVEGVRIVEVPTGVTPLYFTYAVAANLRAPGTGETANKLVWRLR